MDTSDPNSPYYIPPQPVMIIVGMDMGNYVGELDHQHGRTGVGSCKWADGSSYEGDWYANVRHGNGVYITSNGTKYEGQWVNDKKHGNGRLAMPNGDTIESTWINDRLNGLALVKKGDKTETVIFKDDMKIMANNSGMDCGDWVYTVVSVILFFGFWILLPLQAATDTFKGLSEGEDKNSGWGIVGIVYIVYQVYSCGSKSTKFIRNLIGIDKVFPKMQKGIDAKPEVTHHVQSYHYETRHHKDSNGNSRTTKVRVNTHTAVKEQKIKKWEDQSPPVATLHFLSVLLLTRLWTHKEINYTSTAWKKWKKTKKKIIKKNKHRDTHW